MFIISEIEILSWPFTKETIQQMNQQVTYANYPVIYLLNGDKEAYIGETVYFKRRMREHLRTRKHVNRMHVIQHEKFNRSATFHLETKLINYFLGDEKYILQNKSKVVNDFTHNYYNKSYYDQTLFQALWQTLYEKKLVDHPLHVIENKDIFKLSPFKELSLEQIELKENILAFCEQYIQEETKEYGNLLVIEGEAGVGKSVVLSSIFNTMQEQVGEPSSPLYNTENYLVVNHEEMFKTYKAIAKQVQHLKVKHFAKPTPLINRLKKKNDKVDIILVDEAHLLLTKSDAYNNFKEDNHLEELLKLAKIVIVIYDQDQVLKLKSLWDTIKLEQLKALSQHCETYQLTNQFRMQANDDVLAWINAFKNKQLLPLPKDAQYDFRVFDTLEAMHDAIKSCNQTLGLSRVVATFDYLHKKDGGTYYINESNGEYKMPWNTTNPTYTWAENPSTINEAGSIYTIQGFDLNYVGVVLGPSIQYRNGQLVIDTSLYMDKGAYAGAEGIDQVALAKEKIILNSVNILMKRGIKGLYIYASDKALRQTLLGVQQ